MSIYTPFTYLITHIPTGKRYYGVRFRKGCQPSDIGTKYFSSSKVVKKMIAEEGLDKFKFEVRRTFATANSAVNWEHRVLTRLKVWNNDAWLNETNNNKNFFFGKSHTENTKKLMSQAHIGKPKPPRTKEHTDKINASKKERGIRSWNLGLNKKNDPRVARTPESIEKTAAAHRGMKRSAETKEKMRNWQIGKVIPDEQRIQISRTLKLRSWMQKYNKRRPLGPYASLIKY